jgi:3-isopropylmalate/(R)-2-methylmalate dehydratase large subunit
LDHIIPTASQARPYVDPLAEEMMRELEKNTREFGITFFSPETGDQGIVHIIGPEFGLTQPGMTVCCGDSHTATHGAFGAIAFGIAPRRCATRAPRAAWRWANSKCAASRSMAACARGLRQGCDPLYHPETRREWRRGIRLRIRGEVFERMNMEERMTVCNMSIEGGARCG